MNTLNQKGEKQIITKVKIHNFKCYKQAEFDCNKKMNIFVGENGAGKSTLLYAIGLVLSGSYNQIEKQSLSTLFNTEIIEEFLQKKDDSNLPQLFVELYFDSTLQEIKSNFHIEGRHNSDKIEAYGLSLRIVPHEEYIAEIKEALKNTEWEVFPFEYYKVEFITFSGKSYSSYTKPYKFSYTMINTSLIDTNQETQKRIHEIYAENISEENRAKVNHSYRKSSQDFLENLKKEHLLKETDLEFELHFDDTESAFKNAISVMKNKVDIKQLGQGEKVLMSVDNSYRHMKDTVKILLVEEPENHLSYQNLQKLVNLLSADSSVQVFIGTHSNMIASRLGINHLFFIDQAKIFKLQEMKEDTIRYFKKSTNQSLLNFILGKKIILVEGNAEYILMEKFFEMIHKKKPEDCQVSIISVDGLSFKRYLEIAETFENKKVGVITDNDRNYQKNIVEKYQDYRTIPKIQIFSDNDNENNTFEVCIYNNNKEFIEERKLTSSNDKLNFMLREKAEFALRLLEKLEELEELEESDERFEIPQYIREGIEWVIKD